MGSEHRIHTVMWLLMRRKMINFCFDTNQLDVKSGRKGKKKGKGKKKKTTGSNSLADRHCQRLWMNGGSRRLW